MNAYAKAQQLGLTGSDTEIIGVLRTLTARPIELWQLREYLRQTQILVRGRNGWSGPLAAVESPVIDLLIDALDDLRQTIIDSNKPTWGPVFYAGLASLVPDLLTAEQMTAVLELGGGLPFAELIEEDFADQRAEAMEQVDRKAAYNAIVERANEAIGAAAMALETGSTPVEITQAAESAWEGE